MGHASTPDVRSTPDGRSSTDAFDASHATDAARYARYAADDGDGTTTLVPRLVPSTPTCLRAATNEHVGELVPICADRSTHRASRKLRCTRGGRGCLRRC